MNRKTTGKNETKSWYFEKTSKINKPLTRWTKRRLKLLKIRNESGDMFAYSIEIKHKSTVNMFAKKKKSWVV